MAAHAIGPLTEALCACSLKRMAKLDASARIQADINCTRRNRSCPSAACLSCLTMWTRWRDRPRHACGVFPRDAQRDASPHAMRNEIVQGRIGTPGLLLTK